jgi:hypothetical protein
MITVEQVFYCVLAHVDHSELLPLSRALRAVELHIRRECQREMALWRALYDVCSRERVSLCDEVDGLRAFKRSVDYALNSGDGSYRP